MRRLEVSLFGRLSVQWDDDQTVSIHSLNAQKLFSYLLVFRQRAHLRETLAELLWSDYGPSRARAYLRKALWELQNALAAEENGVLLVESDWLQINPDASPWLDLELFELALSKTHHCQGNNIDENDVRLLEEAAALYRGNLFEGCYDEWCLLERERFLRMYLIMLAKLATYSESHNLNEAGITYALSMLRHNSTHEGAHRQLMRLYYASGDRTSALRQYHRCQELLAEELDVEPAAQTTALYEQIRAAHLPSNGQRMAARNLRSWQHRLLEVQTVLQQLQSRLREDISVVESLLHEHQDS